MAGSKSSKRHYVRFIGLGPQEAPPRLVVLALGSDGQVLHSAPVDDEGGFDLGSEILDKAARILMGPADADPAELTAFSRYRPATFAKLLAGDLNIARAQWQRWHLFVQCVTGSVWRCRRSPWWFDDLVALARVQPVERVLRATGTALTRQPAARSLPELIAWPKRCAVICNGVVEVWRRTCCCEPWVIDDPRLPDLVAHLEDLVRVVPKIPERFPPPPPPPPPEAAPDLMPDLAGPDLPFLRDGALDEMAVYAARDLHALRTLPRTEIAGYVNARAYLICRFYSCSTPVKVAQGEINPDGRFNICWREFPRILRIGCHDEYAYVVRQRFGPFSIVVYNGVAAGKWYSADTDARLESYHPWAFSCRPPGAPGTGAFAYLDLIGDTTSNELETPAATGWDRVAVPGATSGTLFPVAGPFGHHRNLGRTLKLSYLFSEDLKLIGAKYYRIGISAADAFGNPVGPRDYWDAGLSWRKAVPTGTGVDVITVSLGPNPTPIGGQSFLYEIPFDLPPGAGDWEGDQYHAHLDTTDSRWSEPTVRHLVTLEIFDAAGKRLRPTGTPATGQSGAEGTAAFTYRRKTALTGPTLNVPFGALTHLFWWDNRDVEALITQLRMDGLASSAECQFLVGTPASQFSIDYRAYHPEQLFQHYHRITWRRGLAGGSGTLLPPTSVNVGQPPAAPGTSPAASFGTMLDLAGDPTRKRCAFTVFLGIYNKRTDGDDYDYPYREDSAAFALEVS